MVAAGGFVVYFLSIVLFTFSGQQYIFFCMSQASLFTLMFQGAAHHNDVGDSNEHVDDDPDQPYLNMCTCPYYQFLRDLGI